MNYSYILHEYAQQDYEEAIKWYMERSVKAAENLMREINAVLQLICESPDRWRNEYKDYRELGVRKYPYVIIYTIENEKKLVVVTAIFHTSRNPSKKYRKIK